MGNKKKIIIVTFTLILTCLVMSMIVFFSLKEKYVTIPSPDGKYSVEIYFYKWEQYIPTMPGQSGDKSGVLYLKNSKGKILYKVALPMVSYGEGIQWEGNRMRIPCICDVVVKGDVVLEE